MPASREQKAQDIAGVGIPADAYWFLQDFIGTLQRTILESAAREALRRPPGSGHVAGRVKVEDILRAAHLRLPEAMDEIERLLKLKDAHVRSAS
jgi:hypothetical protein